MGEAKGKPLKPAEIQVTFDALNASDGLDNGLTTDNGSPVVDGVDGTEAIVGGNFQIIADLLASTRGLSLDLSQSLATASTTILVPDSLNPGIPNVECGRIDLGDSYSTALLAGSWDFAETKFRLLGRDYLKLEPGAVCPINADLEFHDAGGNRWLLRWGPHEGGGGVSYNPGSDPVTVERVDANTWTFTTTGEHHAALYRYAGSQRDSQHYYGQFVVPFSGTALALTNQTVPDETIPAIVVTITRRKSGSPARPAVRPCRLDRM